MPTPSRLQSTTSRKVSLCIDWISTTSHDAVEKHVYSSYPLLHDWENWRECVARNGYTIGAKHVTGVTSFMNLDRLDMGIHTIYSGRALRRVSSMDGTSGFDILKHHVESGHNIARVDIALDFINHGLTVGDFVNQWENGSVVTRLRSANIVKSLDDDGYTLYLGSQKARKKLVRIYNKGAETNTGIDWIRVELQLMGKPATKLSRLWLESGDSHEFLLRGLKNVVDFPHLDIWRGVFDGVIPLSIGSQSSNKGDTRDWLLNKVVPSLAREIVLDTSFWVQFSYMARKEVSRLGGEVLE